MARGQRSLLEPDGGAAPADEDVEMAAEPLDGSALSPRDLEGGLDAGAHGYGSDGCGTPPAQDEDRLSAAGDGAAPADASGAAAAAAPEGAERPKRQVTLLPSVFEGRPPVLLFHYTVACGAPQRPMERAVASSLEAPRLYYSHTDKVHEYNAVINILRQGGLHRVRADTQRWSLLWSNHPPPEVLRAMKPTQRTNHFPGSFHLGRKDLIWKNLSRMQRRFGRAYHVTPQAYVLPKNMALWEAARLRQPGSLWIWKPCSQSCGRGIKVLGSDLSQADARELGRKRGVVQKYIHNPLLLEGYKFDLRIYVVVLSYDPLKVYINDEGLVRLATEKYSSSPDTLESRTMHLTNYSVNKLSPAFVQNRDGRVPKGGEESDGEDRRAFKWSLEELRSHFDEKGWDYPGLFDRIKELVIKTLIAVEGPLRQEWAKSVDREEEGWEAVGASGASRSSCFEIYGFDVLVDSAMKPWLLEVNICPSLSSGSPLDKRIKTKLVADALTLVGIRPPPSVWRRSLEVSPARAVGEPEHAEELPSPTPAGAAAAAGADGTEEGSRAVAAAARAEAMEQRIAELLSCETAAEAVAHFTRAEWELVLDAHDEDMRSGGLERIFPTATSAEYVPFFNGEESLHNLVLRLWLEAGGGELFGKGRSRKLVPPWVPRQVCFLRT